MRFQLAASAAQPELLGLPWDRPLTDWGPQFLVPVRVRGISRHVVRFASVGGALHALKEIPEPLAARELRLLRQLADERVPAVEPVGLVADRGLSPDLDGPLDAVLITRYLDFSLPYRTLFASRAAADVVSRLIDALVELLVRLHLVGFFWGDCSLSNTLFRRDAGALAAYLVDAETGEHHPGLTHGQRAYDLALAEERVAGELLDLVAAGTLQAELDPAEVGGDVVRRYGRLWDELTREELLDPDDAYQVEARVRRLGDLGYDVSELSLVTTERGSRLRLRTQVVEPGHHQRALFMQTGLDVQENQARRLLSDLESFRARLAQQRGGPVAPAVAAARWRQEVFEAAIAAVPPHLRHKLEPAELYHQLLDHRWYLSEASGHDVGLTAAVRSYVETVLPAIPDERTAFVAPPDDG